MHFRLIAVDKIRSPYVAQACGEFERRLRPYAPIEIVEVRAADGSQPIAAMEAEAQRILKLVRPGETIWLLEREGTELSSLECSERIAALADAGTQRLTFVIAGTYGASPELQARCDFAWSLSRLTFLHEWARMLVLEQLYRAAKIARNEPYHH